MRDEYRAVTVHDLLTGASGLLLMQRSDLEPPEHATVLFDDLPGRVADPVAQRHAVALHALAQPPRFARGTRHEYSNVGWALAGHVLEVRTGTTWERLVKERIFDPLGMAGALTGGWPASPDAPNQPRGHYVDTRGLRPQPLDDAYVLPAWMNPAGGIQLTVDDFAEWARETLRGLRGEGRLLAKAGYERIHSIQLRVRANEMCT